MLLKAQIKLEKIIIKSGDTEIQKQKFYQHKGPISIKNTDINKIVVSNKVFFGKKDLNISLVIKMIKKLDPYIHSSPKNECIQKRL